MNRNHLALFNAVAQSGNISRASEQVRVSQPAVSKQIAELERALGVRLLDRLPRGCRLTEAGLILADYARRWCSLESEAARAIEEFRTVKRGRLAVGASMTIGAYLLPRVLADFRRRFPDLELNLQIANTQDIHSQLLDGVVDVGLTEGLIESKELQSEVFFQDELVAIVCVGHPLLRRPSITIRELCREPFIMREEGSGTRAVVERALRKRGLKVKPVLSIASPESIKNCVSCGMGVAMVSRLIVEAEVTSGLLKIVPLADFTVHRPLHLQRMLNKSETPALAKFLSVLEQHKMNRFGERKSQTPSRS